MHVVWSCQRELWEMKEVSSRDREVDTTKVQCVLTEQPRQPMKMTDLMMESERLSEDGIFL